jgi:hypothetical protein
MAFGYDGFGHGVWKYLIYICIYLIFGFSDGSNERYWDGYTGGKRNDTMGLEYSSNTTLAKEFWATVSIFC